MRNDDRRFDRRSVLKATGVALATTAGAAGSASAAKFYIGEKVYPTATVSTYETACPTPDTPGGPTVEEGEELWTRNHCTELSTGEEYYELSETEFGPSIGWLEESLLES